MWALVRRLWGRLRRPSVNWASGTLLLGGFMTALITWAAFSSFVDYSSTLSFCTSCHEMRDYVYEEYKESPHYLNRSGVRAICADCHVPHEFGPKMLRKMRATVDEVPQHFIGRIDTREKFEAHRLELAQSVWAEMKANSSRECRKCHDPQVMKLTQQKPRAQAQHEDAKKSGETCIDCHKGIAHHRPSEPDKDNGKAADDFNL